MKSLAKKSYSLFFTLLLLSRVSMGAEPAKAVELPKSSTPTVVVTKPVPATVANAQNQPKQQRTKPYDLSGSHTGYRLDDKGSDDDRYELLLRTVPGKIGSYWALLINVEKSSAPEAQLFRMDPFGLGKYGMYTVAVNEQTQSLLINDGRPTMIFSVEGFGSANRPLITIYPNKDSSQSQDRNSQAGFRFYNKRSSDWRWVDLDPGFYSDSCFGAPQATVGPLIDGQDSSTSFCGLGGASGGYILRKQFPGIYSVHRSELSEVNVHLKITMEGLVFFLDETDWWNDRIMLFVDKQGRQSRADRK